MHYAHTKNKNYIFQNAFKACAPYSFTCKQATKQTNTHHTPITMTTTPSTRLYDQACIAQNIAQKRLQAARLSVPDELHWYNNHTNWDALSRKEFREVMIRMETITAQHYNDFGTTSRCNRAAIKAFWAEEWGCEYVPESGKWLNLATGSVIKSETEKKADRDAKKALKKALKEAAPTKAPTKNQYNDEEEEVYELAAAAQKQQQQQQQQHQQQQTYDDWFDAEEEAYAEAYAQARAQEDQTAQAKAQTAQAQQQQQQKEQQEQAEAQSYLDSFAFDYTSEEATATPTTTTRVCCQAVLYMEELTEVQGDPDWRAYIYYDARIHRFVFKGTRRSLRATSKKTVFPEIKLCFRSSRELARYLCSSTDGLLNVSMLAMSSATVKDATFAELYALPARGSKTELFGYDETRPRFSTFVNYLCMVRDIDAAHSTFASF